MAELTFTEVQKEEIQKEIKIIKYSKTGKLYFKKKFNGNDPTETEMVKTNGCGLYALVKWLTETGKDKEMKSHIQHLTGKGDEYAAAELIEEIALFKGFFAGEIFRIKEMQSLRKNLDNKLRKEKERKFTRKEKAIQEIAKDDPDSINVEKALEAARRKANETPPPPYLYFASEALNHGVMWYDRDIKQSSKGSQVLRRFISKAYQTAKTQTTANDNSIFENIAAILNILGVKGDAHFTGKNVQGYVKKYCTE